jgi:hypothetical protein
MLCALACASCTTRDARVEAIGRMDAWDFEGASEQLAPCLYSGDEGDRFLCQDMLGAIRVRQHRWQAAATAYRYAFEIRDRIAKARGYGSPSNESLTNWGFALLRTGDRAKARAVFARVERDRGDWKPYENAALAARVLMAHADDDVATEQKLRAEVEPCETTHVENFDPKLRNIITAAYLPADAWVALGDACNGPERGSFYERALALSKEEHDDDAAKICAARIANGGP